jgi:eukaryotic-like serine/threonine-protein kinase
VTQSSDDLRAPAPIPPLLDGRYRVESLLGRGGMGTVYRAIDTRLGRPVAVKLIVESEAADEERFRAEVRTLAQLSHPNLVRLLDAGISAGRLFFVMELIEGSTLGTRLQEGPLSTDEAAVLGSGVASALAYVHRAGIVHRDIKPANILIDRDGAPHLADFGIARLVDSTGMTASGLALGTPAYLAPEQVQGDRIGPEADVYALGLVLVECITGARAFTGTASEVTAARLHRSPELPPWLEPEWRQVLTGMTALASAERPTAGAVHKHLAEMTHSLATVPLLGGVPLPAGKGGTGLLPKRDPAPFVNGTRSRTESERRNRAILGGAIAAVVAALFVLLAVLGVFSGSPSPSGASTHPPTTPNLTRSSTAVSSTTTSTTPPTTTTLSVPGAAGGLVAAIEAGVRAGSINPNAGQQLVTSLNQVLNSPQPQPVNQEAQQLTQFASMLGQDIGQGQVTGTAVTTVTKG